MQNTKKHPQGVFLYLPSTTPHNPISLCQYGDKAKLFLIIHGTMEKIWVC